MRKPAPCAGSRPEAGRWLQGRRRIDARGSMTMRLLTVPVSGHPADEATLETAFMLGEPFSSHINAVCICPDPADIVRYVAEWSYPTLVEDAVATAEQHAAELSRDAAAMFGAWREKRQIPLVDAPSRTSGVTTSWHEEIGTPGATLGDIARFTDLVIMRGLGEEGPVEGDAMLEAVLFDAGRPVMLVPRETPAPLFDAALIGWGGGREESHAILAALPILSRMRRVEICTVGDRNGTGLDALVSYLAWNGIAATAATLKPGPKGVSDALLDEAERIGATLLVVGGYHHSRTREAVFGGTTRRIVANVKIPVLLAH